MKNFVETVMIIIYLAVAIFISLFAWFLVSLAGFDTALADPPRLINLIRMLGFGAIAFLTIPATIWWLVHRIRKENRKSL